VYLDNSEKQPDNDNTVNMGVFSTSTYNSHYISGRSDVNTVDYYHMGGHTDDYRFYDKALDSTERNIVYNYAPIELENYTVDVSNGVFRLDSGDGNGFVEKPSINFNSGTTYIFDLSHNSNAGNTLVLGTIPDSSTNLIDYQTVVGTPGQPGAYTTFTASGETVFYYSFETPGMGYEPPTYTVQKEINVLGDTVFSIKKPGESVFYTQPDLSFGAGFIGLFDVADIGSYSLVFGTEVDVSSTIQRQYYSQTGDIIVLSIPSDYSGNSLKYFEDTSAGMGYMPPSGTE
jgi:hypothetical protein